MPIPKIIHQIWIGPKKRPDALLKTWRDKHPASEGWEHWIWGNEDIQEFGMKNIRHFNEIEEWAGKADIWRYEILHRYGGVFCDADSICTNQLDEHFFEHDSFAGFENETVRPNLIANGYIGASKGNEFMKILIDELYKTPSVTQKYTGRMAWQNTGPLFFTQQIIKYQYPISIYPSFVFIPEHYTGIKYQGEGKSYSQQLWGSTQELGANPNFYNDL
jgi:mannosyltransferase OCH1-like enzyme